MKWKVVRPCMNQDTGKRMAVGDIIEHLSAFEMGRHLAEKNIIPMPDNEVKVETAMAQEARRGKRIV